MSRGQLHCERAPYGHGHHGSSLHVENLERFPNDGNRYELLDGVLLVTPAPAPVHQLVASRIQTRLAIALQETGFAHVVGLGAVIHRPNTQLPPDVLVYPSRFSPRSGWVDIDEH